MSWQESIVRVPFKECVLVPHWFPLAHVFSIHLSFAGVVSQTVASGKRSVANLSLGGGFSFALNRAVARATASGVVMVVAAGNADQNACLSSPAGAESAITVGSTMRLPLDTRSSFSK